MDRREFLKGLSAIVLSSSFYSFDLFGKESIISKKLNNGLSEENIRILDDNELYIAKAYSKGFRVGDAVIIEVEPKRDINFIFSHSKMKKSKDFKSEPEDFSFMSNFIYCNGKAYTITGTDRHCPEQKIGVNLRLFHDDINIEFNPFRRVPMNRVLNHYDIEICDRDWIKQYIPIYNPNKKTKYKPTQAEIDSYIERRRREVNLLPKSWQSTTPRYYFLEGYASPRPICNSASYGATRFNYYYGTSPSKNWPREHHMGTDCSGNHGTTIKAALSGKVAYTDKWLPGIGSVVVLNHGIGLYTLYGHMSKQFVQLDQEIVKGQSIGLVGNTGGSTGPHLHFTAKLHGMSIDGESLDILNKIFYAETIYPK